MKVIISHTTAFNYYRWFRCNRNFSFKRNILVDKKTQIPQYYRSRDLFDLKVNLENLYHEKKHNILISNLKHRYPIKNFQLLYSNLKYPNDSFCKIDEGLLIPSPELLFYQLASAFDFPRLMLAGLELCGTYSINPSTKDLTVDVLSVTTTQKIIMYLNKLKKSNKYANGINKALYAAKVLCNNSFSPLESRLYVMLCGPRCCGGYGLRNFKFNQKVELSKKAMRISSRKFIYPDLCNFNTKVAIEYDSDTFHNNIAQNNVDKLRINALQSDG